MNNKAVHMVAFVLLVVGGLNWALTGIFDINLVEYLSSGLAKTVYALIGLAALYEIIMHKSNCRMCEPT